MPCKPQFYYKTVGCKGYELHGRVVMINGYADMVEFMKAAAKVDPELTVEERNLFSVAYNNAIGPRLASWRTVSSIEEKMEQNDGYPKTKLSLLVLQRNCKCKEVSRDLESLGGLKSQFCNVKYISSRGCKQGSAFT